MRVKSSQTTKTFLHKNLVHKQFLSRRILELRKCVHVTQFRQSKNCVTECDTCKQKGTVYVATVHWGSSQIFTNTQKSQQKLR